MIHGTTSVLGAICNSVGDACTSAGDFLGDDLKLISHILSFTSFRLFRILKMTF